MNLSFEFIVNIAVLVAQLYLGLIVILHNPRSFTHRFFLGLVAFMAIQGVVQSFVVSTNIGGNFDIQSRLSISLVPIQLLFLLFFIINFPDNKPKIKTSYLGIFFLLILGLTAISNTNLVFESFTIENGVAKAQPGSLFLIFTAALILLVLSNIVGIFIKYRKTPRESKKQIIIIGIGLALTFLGLFMTQYILPNFYSNANFLSLISLFTLPLLITTGYAIIGFRVFDVRLVSAEVFTLLTWVLFFVAFFFQPENTGPAYPIIIVALLLIMGILLTRNMTIEVKRRDQLEKLTEELKQTNVELRKAKIELEKLSQFKTQILSFASHQIKAPLAIIKQFASILAEGLYGPVTDKIKETLTKMKNSSDELIDLINTLLDLRKVEEGRMEYKFETIKLKDLVQGSFDNLKLQADSKKLEFTFTSGYEGNVNADPQKLKQVIQNLIENSIKYTPAGFVRVATKEEGDSVIFSVSDSGLGVSPTLLPNLFGQEFVRDERIKREIKGTGLGLYIAQSIVTAHNGKIWAESEGDNKGSQFYVKLKRI